MARFGQAFISQLTNPSYQQGMFDAAQQLGAAPAVARERSRREEMIQGLLSGTPIQQGKILQQEGLRSNDIEMALKGRQLEEKALQSGATQGIQALVTQISNPETDDALAKQSRQTALRLARENNVPEDRVRTALDAADKSRLTQKFSSEVPKIKGLTLEASKMISSGQTKEDFVAKHGQEYSFVFDETEAQIEQTKINLSNAKEKSRLSEYQYTDNQLEELGLTKNQIDRINSLPGGRSKNAAVYKFLTEKANTQPSAAIVRVYADAFVSDIMAENGWDYDDEEELKEAEALAAKKALSILTTVGDNPAEVANVVVNEKETTEEDVDLDSAIAEIRKALTEEE